MSFLGDISHHLGRTLAFRAAVEAAHGGEDVTLAAPSLVRPVLTAALFLAAPAPTLVVLSGEDAADRFALQMRSFLHADTVLRLPSREALPWRRDERDPRAVGMRARALHALERGRPVVVVASARSLMRRVPPQGSQLFEPLSAAPGDELDLDEAVCRLADMGYARVDSAEEPGDFAVRGGILDVYPSDGRHPVRVELFGDEVERVLKYVPSTGQVLGSAEALEAYPCREVRLSTRAARAARAALEREAREDEHVAQDLDMIEQGVYFDGVERYAPLFYRSPGRVTDYLPAEAAVVAVEPRSLVDDARRRWEEVERQAEAAEEGAVRFWLAPAELDLGTRRRVTLLSLMRAGGAVDGTLEARRPDVAGGEDPLLEGARTLLASGYRVALAAREERTLDRLADLLVDGGVPVRRYGHAFPAEPGEDAAPGFEPDAVHLVTADVPAGFVVRDAGLAVLSVDDVYPRGARVRGDGDGGRRETAFDFAPGDHVVHATHGVALFREMVRKTVLGAERDYLLLEYAQGDRLYVPFEQLDRVTKYVGPDASAPRLTRLDTADWSRATKKARKAARRLAFDLVELYARRAAVEGHAYPPDTPWQAEMEAAFPFEETADQLEAIEDVKSDMRSPRPMDRLVTGDVGYGKTEVALRAAFKAVQDGRQVMVLCPTTVLAQQHHTTFSERFEPFGLRVEVLSRFRTKARQAETLAAFSEGGVDVLIGTHRLLSPDVAPKDLGLVVVDEEQRFGVAQKEHFTHLRAQVDVLALSATPIPRTLQMALSGVRDLSIIDTPPPDRYPVKVHVGEYDPDLVQAAVRAEIERGGQVYYVFNRVRGIEGAVERVRRAVPEARIGVGHGQMSEKRLERVMESFSAGEYDVLVSTTIVESGLDNPHTNTLVIEDSQRLGLAQLYQLKGRVGRSHVRAHAYFFFPRGSRLTDEAYERLTAIGEHAGLGSGLKVAMRDLEIRGAGTLLGAEQHGSMSAVGFELYSRMLRRAVADARGEGLPEIHDVRVDLPVEAFLPEDYVEAVDERVLLYRRLASAETPEAVDALAASITERLGAPPPPARNLFDVARMRAVSADLGLERVALVRGRLVLEPLSPDRARRGRLSASLGAVYTERRARLAVPMEDRDAAAGAPAAGALRVLRDVASILHEDRPEEG